MEVGVEGEVDCSIPTVLVGEVVVLAFVGEDEALRIFVTEAYVLEVEVVLAANGAVGVEEVVAPKVAAEVGGFAEVVVVKEVVAPKVAAEVGGLPNLS